MTTKRLLASGLAYVGCFLAGLVGVRTALEPWLSPPPAGEVAQKLTHLAAHREDYDAVFLGSSRIHAHINPPGFDRRVEELTGKPIHSYNFGAPSMFLPESLYVLDQIMALDSKRLRWIFLELDHPKLRVEEQASLVQRELYWHRPAETVLMCGEVWTDNTLDRREKLLVASHQLALGARRWLHVGRAAEMLAAKFALEEVNPVTAETVDDEGEGYQPYRRTLALPTGKAADARRFLEDVAALEVERSGRPAQAQKISNHARRKRAPQQVNAVLRRALARTAERVRARGKRLVFLVAPGTVSEAGFLRLERAGELRPVLAFNDPAKHPELYRLEVRADTMHLNAAGAELYTSLLAQEFAASPTLRANPAR